MVSHTQLQYYSRNYTLVCMTGLLGCRWHRYKQSTNGSRKIDLIWFSVVLLVALFAIFWFYSVLVGRGDISLYNRFLYDSFKTWIDWYTIMLAVVCVIFSYLMLLMCLSLCHIVQGHQLFIHPVHLVFMVLILAILTTLTTLMYDLNEAQCLSLCHIVQGHQLFIHPVHLVFMVLILAILTTLTTLIYDLNEAQAATIYFSLQIFGPFMQLGAVCLFTILTWVMAHQWFKITRPVWKGVCIAMYIVILLGLYVAPLFVNSPCVIVAENLPPKPKLSAHKGASSIAPENTVISFDIASQYNVYAFETDVRLSLDGVPFLMHDNNLRLTTNVDPSLADLDPAMFNISTLQSLDAGSWFLEKDPWHTVSDLSSAQEEVFRAQTVPTFLEVLQLAAKSSTHVIFDLLLPAKTHPFYNTTVDLTLKAINESGINQSQIFWLSGERSNVFKNFKFLSRALQSVEYLRENNYTGVHFQNSITAARKIKEYRDSGLLTSVYIVDSTWLYSYYWCTGVDMVHTDICDKLSQVEKPIWHLAPETYRALWLTVNLVSAVVVVAMFLVQRSRVVDNKFKPDHSSISSNGETSTPWGNKRSRRSMKEKLLMKDVQAEMFDFEPDETLGIESNSYDATVTATEGRALSQAFQQNRNSYHSNSIQDTTQPDGQQSNRQSVTSVFDENNGINYYGNSSIYGDGLDSNRNSYISNGGTTYQTQAEIV